MTAISPGPSRHLLPVLAGIMALFALLRWLPPPADMPPDAWAVAALLVLMALLWVTEALPLAATAMLPFLLLPLMKVASAGQVAATYWSPTIFLVLGGAIVATAIERHGLHRRLALSLARAAPGSPRGLLLAFMVATAIASMLVSNTATTLIMMPVALAMLAAAEKRLPPETVDGFAIALILGVAWSATIGGLGTLVGSPTNAIAADIVNRGLGTNIDFLTWALFGLPLVAVAIPATAFLLIRQFAVPAGVLDRAAILEAIGAPGPMRTDEKRLIPLVLLMLAGWMLLPVLGPRLGLPPIDDGMVAIGVALLLFIVPAEKGGTLLAWSDTRRVPWDILLLFGGGLALADAITTTGLAEWLGGRISGLADWPLLAVAAVMVALIILVTEFASNVATASGFMPIVAVVVLATGADPLLLAMPAAIASTWGFMMPAGTGPNAIAYGTGRVPIQAMIAAGLRLDLIGIPIILGVCFVVAALL